MIRFSKNNLALLRICKRQSGGFSPGGAITAHITPAPLPLARKTAVALLARDQSLWTAQTNWGVERRVAYPCPSTGPFSVRETRSYSKQQKDPPKQKRAGVGFSVPESNTLAILKTPKNVAPMQLN